MKNQINASASIAVETFFNANNLVTFPWGFDGEIVRTQGWVLKLHHGAQTQAGDEAVHETQAPCSPDSSLKTTRLSPLSMEEVHALVDRVNTLCESGVSPYEYVDNAHHWSTDGKFFLSRFLSPWYDETRSGNSEGLPEVWFINLEDVLEEYTRIHQEGILRVSLLRETTDWKGFLERIQKLNWFSDYAREKGWASSMITTLSETEFVIHNLGTVQEWEVSYLAARAWVSLSDFVTRDSSERTSYLKFEILNNQGEVILDRSYSA